jgi:uncharacterized protein with LGFP repeats
VCCNAFRYGQCNTQIRCTGGVYCRMVSCVAPYRWEKCTTTSLTDNRTAQHSAPCLPQWGPIEKKYIAMGAQASYLKASRGPITAVGDNRGAYVLYQGGAIYYLAAFGAVAMTEVVRALFVANGGPRGIQLGYPMADRRTGLVGGGWIQLFQRGCITGSTATAAQCVWGTRWNAYELLGREGGALGYPVGAMTSSTQSGWIQLFQHGAIAQCASTAQAVVTRDSYTKWTALSRERGVLGYPLRAAEAAAASGWIQLFQHGATCGGPVPVQAVVDPMFQPWVAAGREGGVLGYPVGAATATTRGSTQSFQRGELWGLTGGTPHRVYGAVLTAWKAAGGAEGSYGYPVSDTGPTPDGTQLTCTFEGGTITA